MILFTLVICLRCLCRIYANGLGIAAVLNFEAQKLMRSTKLQFWLRGKGGSSFANFGLYFGLWGLQFSNHELQKQNINT
jgi:hypothetical protein